MFVEIELFEALITADCIDSGSVDNPGNELARNHPAFEDLYPTCLAVPRLNSGWLYNPDSPKASHFF